MVAVSVGEGGEGDGTAEMEVVARSWCYRGGVGGGLCTVVMTMLVRGSCGRQQWWRRWPSYERDTSTEVQHLNNDEYDNVFAFDNVFAHERQHHEQPESINDTYVVDLDDSNIIFEASYIDPNRGEEEHDNVDYEQECALIASSVKKLDYHI
ncbi:hypothetical protein Tco_1360414 [Tanacetum coccineum]